MLLFFLTNAIAQKEPEAIRPYRTWIKTVKRGHTVTGFLYAAKDSTVILTDASLREDFVDGGFSTEEVPVSNIKSIETRRKGAQGIALGIGTAVGGVIGLAVGAGIRSDGGPNRLESSFNTMKIVFGTLLGAGIGAGISGTIGAIKTKWKIRGSQSQYNLDRREISVRSIEFLLSPDALAGAHFSSLPDSVRVSSGAPVPLLALGGQVWMAENLCETRYRDGSPVSGVQQNPDSGSCLYARSDVESRNPCPAGFHIPSRSEWNSMLVSLGGPGLATRKIQKSFAPSDRILRWWSSTPAEGGGGYVLAVSASTGTTLITTVADSVKLPVRCLRD